MMRPVVKLGRALVTVFVAGGLALLAGPAWAWTIGQAVTPIPSPGPSVDGDVSGGAAAGERLEMRVDASMPGGWRGLSLVEIVLASSGGDELERATYDIENNLLGIGDHEIFLGTGDRVEGRYLRIDGADVAVTTGGIHLSMTVPAIVRRSLPDGARFRLSVTDDHGRTVSVRRDISSAGPSGLGLATVLALITAALFAGAFAGNLIASRRRPPPKLSVYGAIQRQIDAGAAPRGDRP